MAKAFKAVTFTDPDSGTVHRILPGDDVDSDVADLLSDEVRELVFSDPDDPRYDEEGEVRVLSGNSATVQRGQSTGVGDDDDEEDEFSELTVPELRQHAAENDIDLGGATRRKEILRVLRENAAL